MCLTEFLDLRPPMGNASMGKPMQTEQAASFGQRLAEKRQVLQLLDEGIEQLQLKRKAFGSQVAQGSGACPRCCAKGRIGLFLQPRAERTAAHACG